MSRSHTRVHERMGMEYMLWSGCKTLPVDSSRGSVWEGSDSSTGKSRSLWADLEAVDPMLCDC